MFQGRWRKYQNPLTGEYLTGVDDEIPKTISGGEKFSDNNAHQAESDIYFHITDDGWEGAGKYYFFEGLEFGALHCVDKFDFSCINSSEAGI